MKSVPRMLSQRRNSFRASSVCDEIRFAYAQHGFTCKNCSHFTSGWACAKFFFPCMLSMRWNCFIVCSECDKIVSAYALHAHAIIFENCSIKMQMSTIKNQNFETHLIGPKRRFREKIFLDISQKILFGYLSKNIWFRVCSVTKEMFEHWNSGENRRKRSKICFENLPRAYKDLI